MDTNEHESENLKPNGLKFVSIRVQLTKACNSTSSSMSAALPLWFNSSFPMLAEATHPRIVAA
jgi:hypothetical protein